MTEKSNADAANLSFGKELLFVVPLLGSGLAVIFDTRYFVVITVLACGLGCLVGVVSMSPAYSISQWNEIGFDVRLSNIETKNGQIEGVVLRSGDRGILFYDPKIDRVRLDR